MAILNIAQTGYINGTGVRVREAPVTGSALYTATYNHEIQCLATQHASDGYTWLRAKNLSDLTKPTGWVREDLVRGGGYNGGNTGVAKNGVIDGSGVRVRSGPGTSYGTLLLVSTGDRVTYYEGSEIYAGGYTWVRCTSSLWLGNGYIANIYVKPYTGGGGGGTNPPGTDPNAPPNQPYINAANVPLKAAANVSSATRAMLGKYTPLRILNYAVGWYGVYVNMTLSGFVQAGFVTKPVEAYPQTTSRYICSSVACGHEDYHGKRVIPDGYDYYSSCSKHPNCHVIRRQVLQTAYCPWCGDNNMIFDNRGEHVLHLENGTEQVIHQEVTFDITNPTGEFTVAEMNRAMEIMGWSASDYGVSGTEDQGEYTG